MWSLIKEKIHCLHFFPCHYWFFFNFMRRLKLTVRYGRGVVRKKPPWVWHAPGHCWRRYSTLGVSAHPSKVTFTLSESMATEFCSNNSTNVDANTSLVTWSYSRCLHLLLRWPPKKKKESAESWGRQVPWFWGKCLSSGSLLSTQGQPEEFLQA